MQPSVLVTSDFYSYIVYICIPFMTFLSLFALFQRLTMKPTTRSDPRPPKAPKKHLSPTEVKRWQKRISQLDSFTNLDLDRSQIMQSDYRGLINLSLISLFIFVWSHQVRHFLKEGTIWGYQTFFEMFTHTGIGATWAVLVSLAFLAFPVQKAILMFKFPRLLQIFCHTALLAALFAWAVTLIWTHPDWPFIPKGSLCAQLMVLLMKVHSYLHNNREFARRASLKSNGTGETSSKKKNGENPKKPSKESSDATTSSSNASEEFAPQVHFPDNVTVSNFFEFMLFPTLVYELEYPRTERIRIGYVVEKIVMTIGCMACLHLVSQHYVYPALVRSPNEDPVQVIAELIMPFFGCVWLIFYLVFDCICNGMAEVTRFADRQFYTDWWNSTTMDEFARSWNKPVHEWLLRHIYLESIDTYNVSRSSATFVTFLVSSILHELVLVLCFRFFTPFLFLSQMAQIPLIMLGRDLRGTRVGNFFFWLGILLGVPCISVLYCREYFREKSRIAPVGPA